MIQFRRRFFKIVGVVLVANSTVYGLDCKELL